MRERSKRAILKRALDRVLVAAGAVALTLVFFLILPLTQAISQSPESDLVLQTVDTADIPPPPQMEEEPEEEPEPEEKPPELLEDAAPLDLSQLELALNPGFDSGWMTGDFAVKLNTGGGGAAEVEGLFSVADLDQKPRVVYQPSPMLDSKIRKRAPGTVQVLFVVNQQGKVDQPTVQSSTDPVFEAPALAAVKQWKFEPGKRKGQAVRFRMRVPITFPAGG